MFAQFPSNSLGPGSLITVLEPWIRLTRIHKFAGTMLIFWPYAWSLTMVARTIQLSLQSFSIALVLGFIVSSLLHSGGCIWNDILDRKFDRQVERTKTRPIASGAISVPGALAFLFIHIVVLLRLIWDLNDTAFRFGILAMVLLGGFYPMMKRITYWPQAWLGLAMSTGVPMAWLVLEQDLSSPVWILFAGTWAWTMWYDTIYACQDKRDDVKAGVKSTALLFGSYITTILSAFAAGLIVSLFIAGIVNNMGISYFFFSVGGGMLYLMNEMITTNLDSPKSCWQTFHRNGFHFGALIWIGIFVDYILSVKSDHLGVQ